MIEQPSFHFTERKYLALVKLLDRFLMTISDGRWYQARELKALLHISDRRLRQLAEFSRGQIVSGQLGYRLTRCASVDEIDHAEAWLISQGRKMIDRAREIRISRNKGGIAA